MGENWPKMDFEGLLNEKKLSETTAESPVADLTSKQNQPDKKRMSGLKKKVLAVGLAAATLAGGYLHHTSKENSPSPTKLDSGELDKEKFDDDEMNETVKTITDEFGNLTGESWKMIVLLFREGYVKYGAKLGEDAVALKNDQGDSQVVRIERVKFKNVDAKAEVKPVTVIDDRAESPIIEIDAEGRVIAHYKDRSLIEFTEKDEENLEMAKSQFMPPVLERFSPDQLDFIESKIPDDEETKREFLILLNSTPESLLDKMANDQDLLSQKIKEIVDGLEKK